MDQVDTLDHHERYTVDGFHNLLKKRVRSLGIDTLWELVNTLRDPESSRFANVYPEQLDEDAEKWFDENLRDVRRNRFLVTFDEGWRRLHCMFPEGGHWPIGSMEMWIDDRQDGNDVWNVIFRKGRHIWGD
jgi:hypothetical protein